MTSKTQGRVRHKITMALVRAEGGWDTVDELNLLREDAASICVNIQTVYDGKRGAGALWLDRRLQDIDWLADAQEAAMKRARQGARTAKP